MSYGVRRPQNLINRNKILSSSCADIILRGTPEQLVSRHEALGYDAERARNYSLAHMHWQHADHYKRVISGDALHGQ